MPTRMPGAMHALQLLGPGDVRWVQTPAPKIDGPGQVMVDTTHATICGSDLHKVFDGTARQPRPFRPGFPGHEAVGTVVDASSQSVAVGQRVLVIPDMAHAAAFAERQVLPECFVLPLDPEGVPEHQVVAQQLGTVLWALDRFWPPDLPVEGRTAVVLGAGPAGQLFVDRLVARGFPEVVVTDLFTERLRRARERGATATVQADRDDVQQTIADLTDGAGADLVVEAAGVDATRSASVGMVARNARIGWFGTPSSLQPVPFPVADLFLRKPTLMSQHDAQNEPGHASFRRAIDLVESGAIDVHDMVTDWDEPAAVSSLFELARHPSEGSMKVGMFFDA